MRQRIRTYKKLGNGVYYTNSQTIGEAFLTALIRICFILPFYIIIWSIKLPYVWIKKLIEKRKNEHI